MPAREYTHRTCIIVVQISGPRGTMPMGIVVDGVVEVLNIAGADVEDTPSFGKEVEIAYVMGLAKLKGKVKILLDIDQVMTARELSRLDLTAK
jgi:purine-binding chemotaxis protein CheW